MTAPAAASPEHACLLCGFPTTEGGVIHHRRPALVAGVPIDLGDTRFAMRRCGRCGFWFKWPRVSEARLLACYRAAPPGQWGEEVDPRERRYDRFAALAQRYAPGRRVLDVGCFTGTLLDYLGPAWSRFGVEPATDAASRAASRGVAVLGPTLESLGGGVEPFDLIFSVDVLEHVTDPRPHLAAIAARLRPGGCFIAVTGDTSTWPWKLTGARHWYAALPEHVSFYRPSCLAEALRPMGLSLVYRRAMRHARFPVGRQATQLAKNVAYAAAVAAHAAVPSPLTGRAYGRAAPVWHAAPDHAVLVFRRDRPAGQDVTAASR